MGKEHQVRESDREQVGFWSAVDERLGLSGLAYPVPEHANSLPYMLGGISLF